MLRELRANAAAEMTSEMKLQAAASVAPVTQGDEPGVSPAMSCTRAEQREEACVVAQAEGVSNKMESTKRYRIGHPRSRGRAAERRLWSRGRAAERRRRPHARLKSNV